ncbi:putative quinol monooxygenase [Haloflavibacter putidus]|uniref:Antibiotic biosynthesis monooxygenase n=1 Tax=Haloflavibacter putidus TaxID=2576776 RepID=A0A507ZX93_9FLAO|nr:antibiotic biosynthesis monooxygenase family protein [Haloflavibacter putidus]TQD39395.1 antibiotic biosynthesis monooxygenase [Haloflavibacter putidus]
MLVRIVKMTFKTEEIASFQKMFDAKKNLIRNFEGCKFLELYQDRNTPEIFFTYSYWDNEQSLENYRNSALFKATWKETKQKFSQRAEAWSVDKKVTLK